MSPEELSANLDKIKIPQNFMLIKSVNGVYEHQKLCNEIQSEVNKYLEQYKDSKIFTRNQLFGDDIISPILRKKFHKGKCDLTLWKRWLDDKLFTSGGNMGYGRVRAVIIDFSKYKFIPVLGRYDKTEFIDNGNKIAIIYIDSYYFRFNYDSHEHDDIYSYIFDTNTNEFLEVTTKRIAGSGRGYNDPLYRSGR